MFRLDEDRVVDATLSGGLARYINHSCNPNCVAEIVEVERDLRIIIFAKRRISRGEEVSIKAIVESWLKISVFQVDYNHCLNSKMNRFLFLPWKLKLYWRNLEFGFHKLLLCILYNYTSPSQFWLNHYFVAGDIFIGGTHSDTFIF